MTISEKIDKIVAWQNNELVHPLTCINSEHGKLHPLVRKNEIILTCEVCGYIQLYIPEIVLKAEQHDL